MRNLRDVLVTEGGLDLGDWGLGIAYGISADGRTIVGEGGHSGTEAWIATIPEPPTSTLVIAGLVFLLLFARRRRNGIAGTFGSIDSSY